MLDASDVPSFKHFACYMTVPATCHGLFDSVHSHRNEMGSYYTQKYINLDGWHPSVSRHSLYVLVDY